MVSLNKKRAQYSQALADAVAVITRKVSALPEVDRIILFGSYARGRSDLFTDLDVAVIMRSGQSFMERTAAMRKKIDVGVDLDLLVYTPEEWRRNADKSFNAHITKTGRVLYDRRQTK